MNNHQQQTQITAIILAAGMGSRISPLTDNCPKSLLKIEGHTILERMISHIQSCGINRVVIVVGYLKERIQDYIATHFPTLDVHFVINDRYFETNTGYSLLLTRDYVQDSTLIKFDADVVFDKRILENLIECDYETCLCIDTNIQLDAEEIKVIIDEQNRVVKASKTVNPKDAIGESIGIEKISHKTAKILFKELEEMMKDEKNHQQYYESAYEKLIDKRIPFYALDISEFKWIEIDTKEDFIQAKTIFNQN